MKSFVLRRLWEALDYRWFRGPRGGGKPVPAEALDREYRSGAWNHFWSEDEKERHELLVDLVTMVPGPFSILDMGCGSGRLASMLPAARITDYLGVDLSEEGLSQARALHLPFGNFLRADYEIWNPDRTWSVITFNESLGYARDPAATAARFAGFLEPGGRLIVSHFRWGNHEAFWSRITRKFEIPMHRTTSNSRGQIWDLKELRLKAT